MAVSPRLPKMQREALRAIGAGATAAFHVTVFERLERAGLINFNFSTMRLVGRNSYPAYAWSLTDAGLVSAVPAMARAA